RPRDEYELQNARELTRRFYERFDYELPFLAPPRSGLLPVDLHWRIAPKRRLAVDPDRVWERTRRVRVGGAEVPTLDRQAALIHLVLHATTCAFAGFRLLHLCDVVWSVEGNDLEGTCDLAAQWNVADHVKGVI